MMDQAVAIVSPLSAVLRRTLVLAFVVGCGRGGAVAPVAGVVTLDGQPLAGASITTQPIATDSINPGSGSFATTDAQGRFELELVTPAAKGAIVGEHRVMITQATAVASDGPDSDVAARRASAAAAKNWPAKFTDGSLRLQVPPEGDNNVRLDLRR